MKKRFTLLLVLALLFALCACKEKEPLDKDGWHPEVMTVAPTPSPIEGISFTLKEVTRDGKVVAIMTNETDEQWLYGSGYRLDVQVNGCWYKVPTANDGNVAYTSLGYPLASGESKERGFAVGNSLQYGDLPAGIYRIETYDGPISYGLIVEFELP